MEPIVKRARAYPVPTVDQLSEANKAIEILIENYDQAVAWTNRVQMFASEQRINQPLAVVGAIKLLVSLFNLYARVPVAYGWIKRHQGDKSVFLFRCNHALFVTLKGDKQLLIPLKNRDLIQYGGCVIARNNPLLMLFDQIHIVNGGLGYDAFQRRMLNAIERASDVDVERQANVTTATLLNNRTSVLSDLTTLSYTNYKRFIPTGKPKPKDGTCDTEWIHDLNEKQQDVLTRIYNSLKPSMTEHGFCKDSDIRLVLCPEGYTPRFRFERYRGIIPPIQLKLLGKTDLPTFNTRARSGIKRMVETINVYGLDMEAHLKPKEFKAMCIYPLTFTLHAVESTGIATEGEEMVSYPSARIDKRNVMFFAPSMVQVQADD